MMNDGFVCVAAMTPPIKIADPIFNAESSYDAIREAAAADAKVITLPEVTLTSYISNDLLYQETLLDGVEDALKWLLKKTQHLDVVFTIGLPLRVNTKLYNTVAVCHKGRILGIVPKMHIPTYGVDYEGRWFQKGEEKVSLIDTCGQQDVPFGSHQLFRNSLMPELCIAVEICEDIWCPEPPSISHALAGATVICNSSASNASIDKAEYRRNLITGQSARLICAYIYCSSGQGDSTEDVVVGGHDIIASNGALISEARPFENGMAIADIDIASLCGGRRSMSSFTVASTPANAGYYVTDFEMEIPETPLHHKVDKLPFVPRDPKLLKDSCEMVVNIQSHALMTRLTHSGIKNVRVRMNCGADSALALISTIKAFDMMDIPRSQIYALYDEQNTLISVSLPRETCGNTTYETMFKQVSIPEQKTRENSDGLPHDAVSAPSYKEAMHDLVTGLGCTWTSDESPRFDGICIDTHDLTEYAIGTSAYPSNLSIRYAINSGVARSLVPHIIEYLAAQDEYVDVKDALNALVHASDEFIFSEFDNFPTTKNGDIGPVEVQDFYINCLLRSKVSPKKTFRLAKNAFDGDYSPAKLLEWLHVFYERFFASQFIRSCMPDGPSVASVTISPHGDTMLPNDAQSTLWIKEVESLRP